jgi:zinc protease
VTVARVDRSRAPGPGPLRPLNFPAIERFSLANGLPVLFSRTGELPVATFSLILPAGALREPPSASGLAKLTASLLESGTAALDAAAVAERLQGLGVHLHAGTSWEVSHLDFTALAGRTDAAARLSAELVTGAAFPGDEVERLRAEQLAGILQRRSDPRSLANEMAARFIFAPDSPFSHPLFGTADTVSTLDRPDVTAFHARCFTPAGAGLVVAGDLPFDEVRRTCEAAFGGWHGDPLPVPDALAAPRSHEVQVVLVERPGAVQSEIRVGHVGVARRTPDYFSILVMNTILGGFFSSRLNLNLREKYGFTYGASSTFVMRRQPGPFLVVTAVQTEVTGRAIREILQEIQTLRSDAPADAELADARQFLAGTFPLRLQTTDGVASRLADLFIYDLPDSYLAQFGERVLAVSAADVQSAAETYLHPDRLMVLAVGDAEKLRPQLDALQLGPVQVVDREDLA